MKSFINFVVILLISFAGADRINFGSNITNSFNITPFLLIGLFCLFLILIFEIDKLNFSWLFNKQFGVSFFVYLIIATLSIFFSLDILMSSKRMFLIIFIICVFIILLSYYDKKELINITFISSLIASILFVFFNIIMLLNWLEIININGTFINFNPDTIAYFIPRLGGFCSDANRSGFIITFFTFFLIIHNKKSRMINFLIIINIIMIIITLSRTTYIFLILSIFSYLFLQSNYQSFKKLLVLFSIPTALITIGLYNYDLSSIFDIDAALSERFSAFQITRSTSTGIHLKLILDGIYLAFSDLKIFLIGIGQGASYLILDGYWWSGSKYANFHSHYITVLVENGIFALLAFLNFTFIKPCLNNYRNFLFPIIFSLFFYNIFYQLLYEPLYWFIILFFYKINYDIELKTVK